MPRARLLPAALLCTLPLLGCGDDDANVADDPEAAQVAAEQEDVNETREDLEEAREDAEEADEEILDEREDVKEAILKKEEAEDRVGDMERQLEKDLADLEAEKTDAEPNLAADPDVAPVMPDAPDDKKETEVTIESEEDVEVRVEETPGA